MSSSTDHSGRLILATATAAAAAASIISYSLFKYQQTNTHTTQENYPSPAILLSSRPHHHTTTVSPPSTFTSKADPFDPRPRSGYLSWDDYFMSVAFLSSQRSKDPNKQVGACIVDANQVICGIGYNGFPRGCPDEHLPWAKQSVHNDPLATKYPYVCHAEMNAILNKNGASIEGAKMYVTMFPCNECAKLMIQAGIKEVIFHEDKMAIKDTNSSKSKSSNSNSNSRSSGVINGNRPESPPNKDGFKQAEQYAASKRLLEMAGIKVRQHRFKRPVVLELSNDVGATSLPLSTSVFVQGGGRREVGAGGEEGSRMTSTSARSTGGKMMVVEEELEGKDLTKSFLNAIYEPPKPETSVNW